MLERLNKLLIKRADELVFIEIKAGVQLEWNGYKVPQNLPLPIPINRIAGQAQQDSLEDISSKVIIEGIIRILGIDSNCKYKEAYIQALQAYQEDMLETIISLGMKYASDIQYDEAVITFRTALMMDEKNADALINYGRALIDLAKRYDGGRIETTLQDEAIEVFEKFIEIYPDSPLGYYYLGFLYVNKKAYVKATENWGEALKYDLQEDQRDELLTLLLQLDEKRIYEEGYTAVLKGYYLEGLEKLKSLEDQNMDWWNLFFFIGLAYKGLEQYEEAVTNFERVIYLHPSHGETLNELGICHLMLMQYNDAERYFAEGIKYNSDSAELLCNMGILQMEKGKLELALKFLEESLVKNPEDELTKAWKEKAIKQIGIK